MVRYQRERRTDSMTEQEQADFLSGREELRERERLQREVDAQPGAVLEICRSVNQVAVYADSQPLACELPIVDMRHAVAAAQSVARLALEPQRSLGPIWPHAAVTVLCLLRAPFWSDYGSR